MKVRHVKFHQSSSRSDPIICIILLPKKSRCQNYNFKQNLKVRERVKFHKIWAKCPKLLCWQQFLRKNHLMRSAHASFNLLFSWSLEYLCNGQKSKKVVVSWSSLFLVNKMGKLSFFQKKCKNAEISAPDLYLSQFPGVGESKLKNLFLLWFEDSMGSFFSKTRFWM